jgi:hypothetical protein
MAKAVLPPLPYGYNALEPWIDEQTMHLHHDKHHQAYLDNLLKAITGTEFENVDPAKLLSDLVKIPEKIRGIVRNHGGGFVNHSLFWEVMAPKAGGTPTGDLAKALDKAFGGFEAFKEKFAAAAAGQFGSGWAWLACAVQPAQPGQPALLRRPSGARPGRVGARLLPQVPEPPRRVHRELVERHQLGQGGRTLQSRAKIADSSPPSTHPVDS